MYERSDFAIHLAELAPEYQKIAIFKNSLFLLIRPNYLNPDIYANFFNFLFAHTRQSNRLPTIVCIVGQWNLSGQKKGGDKKPDTGVSASGLSFMSRLIILKFISRHKHLGLQFCLTDSEQSGQD